MTRVKRGFKARRRRNKILKQAKGFRGSRNSTFRNALHLVHKGLAYSYRDRRTKKREFRKLWIVRINAAARSHGMRYSEFIDGLNKANIQIDRSVLSNLAIEDKKAFADLVQQAQSALKAS